MYKYSYERVKYHLNGWGGFHGYAYGVEEYQKIIEEKASQGWRYVGYLPIKQRGEGHIQEIDLIFEKLEETN